MYTIKQMNCEVSEVDLTCELELPHVKAALRALLHTVLFHRTLGVVRPADCDCDQPH